MATIDLGKIKIVWRGTYAGGTAYTVDDAVQHTDSGLTSSFICTTASTGNAPSTGGSVHGSWAYLAKGGVAGTDVGTTITTSGDILYRDGSGLQRLAKGTASQTLQMDGSAAFPTWTTVAAPTSDYVKISSGTLGSGTTNWLIDGHFSATYKDYIIYVRELTTGNNGATMYARMNTGGATNSTTNYSFGSVTMYAGSISAQGSSGSNAFRLHQNSNSLDFPSVEQFTIFDPLNASKKTTILYQGFGCDSTGGAINGSYGGVIFKLDTAVTGITIYSDGGADVLTGAEYLVYGLKG